MTWRVTSWSHDEGAGLIASEMGVLPIVRAGALVDDFVIGEEVDVVLEDAAHGVVAGHVGPTKWRENALPLPAAALAELSAELQSTVASVTKVLGPHARVQLALAEEDRISLEIHDCDWPPPLTPPLGKLWFERVAYAKLPAFSEKFVAMSAVPWRVWSRARVKLLRYWSLSRDDVPEGAVVFCFRPMLFDETAGYVIADTVKFEPKKR